MRWRHAPSMTPVAIGQPGFEGLVVVQELALAVQVPDARGGPGALVSVQPGGMGLGGDLRAARSLSPASTARALTAPLSRRDRFRPQGPQGPWLAVNPAASAICAASVKPAASVARSWASLAKVMA